MYGKNFLSTILCVTALLLLSGCAKPDVTPEAMVPGRGYQKELEEYRVRDLAAQKPNPSLWVEVGSRGTLFLDYKGRNVGDIVIVKIVEQSSASNSISTATSKSNAYNAGVNNLMGLPLSLGMNNLLGAGALTPTLDASTENSFTGKGSKQKNDQVKATVATRILEILPSGNLVIEGHREIIVDQEKQVITLRGIVRQKDIDATNTVESTSIADAQISYSGNGVLSDSNKKGWLANAIDWVWPF